MKSETTTPKPQVFDSITDEVDEEDLSCLDVPDIPRDAGRYGKLESTISYGTGDHTTNVIFRRAICTPGWPSLACRRY